VLPSGEENRVEAFTNSMRIICGRSWTTRTLAFVTMPFSMDTVLVKVAMQPTFRDSLWAATPGSRTIMASRCRS
jgi:hypothetical protein